MKLVFTSYTSSPEYSDPQSWLKRIEGYKEILEQLSREHTVISIERINYEGSFVKDGVHYQFMKENRKVLRFPRRLHRVIREIQPDVVFINGLVFPFQVIQLRLAIGKKPKIILLHRSERPPTGRKKLMQQFADRLVDGYLFSSGEFGNHWSGIIDRNKLHEVVLASSVFKQGDRAASRQRLQISGAPIFLWVGTLRTLKDPLTVVKTFLDWLAESPGARLYMIFREDQLLPELKALLEEHGELGKAVTLIGAIEHVQLQDWYNSADFFISGSTHEGIGVALIEAMSCGCIPVVSDIISHRKILGDGTCGFLYEVGNWRSLSEVLRKTKSIDMKREQEKVVKQFQENLSFSAIAEKIKVVLEM